MKWLPPPHEFHARLTAIQAIDKPHYRLRELAALATANLSFLETLQIDAALAQTAQVADSGFDKVRLAVLAGSTMDHLLPSIRVAGLRRGLCIETYAAGYRQYRQELLAQTAGIRDFKPDVVLFNLVASEFIGATPITASSEESDHLVEAIAQDLQSMWNLVKDE